MNEGQKIRLCRSLYGWLQALVGVLVILVLCFTFFGRVMAVDGHSMEPTLEDRSLMLVRRAGYTPAAGDVVVLRKAFGLTDGPIVKRIVATGGQRVEIDYRAGTVTVDGQVLCEPYIKEAMAQPDFQDMVQEGTDLAIFHPNHWKLLRERRAVPLFLRLTLRKMAKQVLRNPLVQRVVRRRICI